MKRLRKQNKHFSIILDSSSDISHINKLTFVVHYEKKDGLPIGQFLKFIPNTGHKTQVLGDAVTTIPGTLNTDMTDHQGQSCDNTATTSGTTELPTGKN